MSNSFIKMHGTGNDFVVWDARAREFPLSHAKIHELSDRHTGIGFDQFIVLKPSIKADVFMQIFNADGSEVDACGNASRCIGWLIANEKNMMEITIETNAGILKAKLAGNHKVSVNMGKPKFSWQEIPLASEKDTTQLSLNHALPLAFCVNMGNPHAIFFVGTHERIDLAKIGSELEINPIFPERANISIARVLDESHIKLDVWERGAGITRSCGTAACATLVAAVERNLTHPRAEVELPGGNLEIFWDKTGTGDVWMTGAVAESFRGNIS